MQQLISLRRRRRTTRARRVAVAGVATLAVVAVGTAATAAVLTGGFGSSQVGTDNGQGILLPTNQRIKPVGDRLLVNNGRLLSSSISPNGKYLAALTWNQFTGFLTVIDLQSKKVIQQVGTGVGTDKTIGDGTVAADGPLWSADGKSLWLSQTADLVRFNVATNGTIAPNPTTIALQTAVTDLNSGTKIVPDLPSGMALSADGKQLYVALNGVNRLGVIDTATNKLVRATGVGNAPRQVALVGKYAFVSNEGGRYAKPGEYTNRSAGTPIVANKVTGAASTGTVSKVDVTTGQKVADIPVGLQPTAEYVTRDGALLVANSNNDSFSIIDPASGAVLRTVNVNPLPGSSVGSNPNAITMPDAHTILVSIGRDNALAVYSYSGPKAPVKYVGLLPTDFYPVGAAYDPALGKIVVTNDKGIGSRGPQTPIDEGPGTSPAPASATGHNTYNDTGSITTFAMPSAAAISSYTHQVFVNNDWEHLLASSAKTTSTAAPVAVPVKLGDPSTIKHVFVFVRENRTYDQVLGDIPKGNGSAALAQFGAKVTPNAHSLANQFGLFDNFYDEGTLSADGHNWVVQADANDYIEKEFGAFYRSYPAQGGDALAYQRNGFLWNAAAAAGKSTKVFGEYNNFLSQPSPTPTWADYYRTSQILEGKASGPLPVPPSAVNTYSDIPSLNAIDDHRYPAFDTGIPDQYRADIWQQSFDSSVKSGQLANLNLIWLPDDHTSGVGNGNPDPVAQVADNDLALGRMISSISHSKYWSSSAVFVVEDDSQNGVDHVDGHRAPALIASPYAKPGVVNSTYYSQLNVVRTIEQILGVAPMNQEDRAAEPMFDAFTNTPNNTPYTTLPNQISLTQGLTPTAAATSATATADTAGSPRLSELVPAAPGSIGVPPSVQSIYEKWVVWSRHSKLSGAGAMVDWANPQQLNRLDWYSAHGWKQPYPGDKAILSPNEVPGAKLPAGYLGEG